MKLKRLLFLPLIFIASTAYAELPTPLGGTAVGIALKNALDSTGKWKRFFVAPGSESQIMDDIGAVARGTQTLTGNIKTNGYYISGDGDNEGISIDGNGDVAIGSNNPDHAGWGGTVLSLESSTIQNYLEIVSNGDSLLTGNSIGGISFQAGSSFRRVLEINGTVVGTDENSGKLSISCLNNGIDIYNGFTMFPSGNIQIAPNVTPITSVDNGAQLQITGSATVSGNMGIGGATNFGTGTGMLAIANGTVTGMAAISGQIEIYAQGGNAHVLDDQGNDTTFGTHKFDQFTPDLSEAYPASFHSENTYLGKQVEINTIKLARLVEQLSGEKLVYYKDIPKRNWSTDQDNYRVQRDLDRLKIEGEIDALNNQIVGIDSQLSVAEEEKKEDLKKSRESLQSLKGQRNKEMPPEYILQHPPQWMQDRGVTLNL